MSARALSTAAALCALLAVPGARAAPAGAPARTARDLKLKLGATGQLCLDCHGGFQRQLQQPFVHTPVKSRECTSCHDPHAAGHGKLLSAEPREVCLTCHADVVPAQRKSAHRPVVESRCGDCHDPHAAGFAANLKKSAKETCAGCHGALAERAAKAKVKHLPLEKTGCSACHEPHASAVAASLLSRPVPELCVRCHDAGKPTFTARHLGYPVGKADCTSCHDPHGSDVPGMLHERAHPPVVKGMCGQCHEPAASPDRFRTRQTGVNLCRGCHGPMLAKVMAKGRVHTPVLAGEACLGCHTPHGATKPGLLRGGALAACGRCHADTLGRQERAATKHGPVRGGDCGKCHDPHSADAPLMLAGADPIELCGKCHDWQKHSSHPIGPKVADPRNRNLSVQCLSCHRAHGTEYKHMMPFPRTTDLCTQCHEQYRR